MGKKRHTYDFVNEAFTSVGYTLLSTFYINNYTKLRYSCDKGHINYIAYGKLAQGRRCPDCAGNKPHTYVDVKKAFGREGYVLLSSEYKNAHIKLDYVCSSGHTNSTTYNSFDQGYRCPYCAGNVKHTYEFVKGVFEEQDYTLLDVEYTNAREPLRYVCPKGHEGSICYSNFSLGQRCSTCWLQTNKGPNNNFYKGGVTGTGLPLYSTYAVQLIKYQNVHEIVHEDLLILGVECFKCNKVFVPTVTSVKARLACISGKISGEGHLYCSDECKNTCDIYNRSKYSKRHENTQAYRPLQKSWASIVKTRDSFTCQICGKDTGIMIAHHIEPVSQNPIESTDVDNGITLCEECDKHVHNLPGCGYNELKCKDK